MSNFKIAYIAYLTTFCLGILGGVLSLPDQIEFSVFCFIISGLSIIQIYINVKAG